MVVGFIANVDRDCVIDNNHGRSDGLYKTMSVSKWAYDPRYCDGEGCPGDCDLCDKPKNMEDEDDCDNCEHDYCPQCADETRRTGMTDYIKRENAINFIANGVYTDTEADMKYTINKFNEYIPSADVVEVVRCDQCRHFDAINNDDHGWCKLISVLPIGVSVRYHDDYCSYGEQQ